jgi:hypothetical protein
LEEGPMVRINATDTEKAPVVFLAKSRENRKGRVLALINTTQKEQQVKLPDLAGMLGKPASAWEDLTPDMIPLKLEPSLDFALAPYRMRLLYNPKGEPLVVEQPQPEEDEPET